MGREEPAAAAEPGFTPPAEFDGFRVIRPLGRGGMGHVYLGHDDMLDRAVALKFLSAAQPKPTARDRFLVEARAIARLQHPNVVGIFRVGEVLGQPYLAYELVAGRSLDQLEKPVPWQRALELGLGVARGLAAAHRRDVLHRDVKPANVMLADTGEVKLLDFGLAKLLDGGPTAAAGEPSVPVPLEGADPALMETVENPRDPATGSSPSPLTVTGALMGTPLYMAPELWRGEAATPQADVYALGLLLYELLSGSLPHQALRLHELAQAVQAREPLPLRSVCPAVPGALADMVDRCLRRRRDERYPTAEEAREALESIRALYQPFGSHEVGALTADDEDAVEVVASFTRVAPRAEAFAARMYERLFARHPEVRPLFPADMKAQRRKLFGALHVIVDNLRQPERLVPLLEDLGRRHAAYGVKPEHFDAVGEALLGAIADHDAGWGEAAAASWTRAYARIVAAMTRGLAGDQLTLPPGHEGGGALARVTWEEQELEPPRTRYAKSGEVNLAYQVLGGGPVDLVLVIGWLTHLEAGWQWPGRARFLRSLAALGRLVVFDARGTGLSDPIGQAALLEERTADLRAVMDAAGVERAALVGLGAGVATCALFAATHPERTRALVLYGGGARTSVDPEAQARTRDQIRASWGEPLFLDRFAPSLARDEPFRRWWARFLRMSASPGGAIAHHQASAAADVRAVLPAIQAPALVLYRTGDAAVDPEEIRFLAGHLPGATLVELPGQDHLPFVGDTPAIVGRIRDFLAGAAVHDPPDDSWIVSAAVSLVSRDPTDAGEGPPSALGTADPVRLLCEREIARFRGIELDGPGRGRAAAMFDGPMRAVRFARAVLARVRLAGVDLAAGVSFDACRLGDAEVEGDAVRLAAGAAARAEPGEVLVTATVKALLAGSGLRFADRGALEGGALLFAVLPDPADAGTAGAR